MPTWTLRIPGFTLIEMMMVLTIIGILAALAYPSYNNFILKSHRSDALTALTQNQLALERCFAQNRSYKEPCVVFNPSSPQGFYTVSLTSLDALTYVLTATPVGNQTNDTICASLSVNQSNVRTAVDSWGAEQSKCWGR